MNFELITVDGPEHSYFPVFAEMYKELTRGLEPIWKNVRRHFYTWSDQDLRDIAEVQADEQTSRCRVCVLLGDGIPIGFIEYSMPVANVLLAIDNIYVREAYRNQGGFNFMYEAILSICRENGITDIELGATVGTPAIEIYERLGFKPVYVKYQIAMNAPEGDRHAK